MFRRPPLLNPVQLLLVSLAIVLIAASWWGVFKLDDGLTVSTEKYEGLSLRYIQPEGGYDLPGVIISHGYGGSQQIMLGYAYAFANSGYAVMMFDFSGHASNPAPMDTDRDSLQADIEKAYQALIAHSEVEEEMIALLGHSMGSGAVMAAGINNPEKYSAVVAVSPTSAEVTDTLPRNLMLQAGTLEGDFIDNAMQLLEEAGGPNLDYESAAARTFVEIDNVEHISILFSDQSHNLAVNWVNNTFEIEKKSNYRDLRIIWYGFHLIGWLILISNAKPFIKFQYSSPPDKVNPLRKWLTFFSAPIAATISLYMLNSSLNTSEFLGLQVGGSLGVWFLVMGLVWLLIGTKIKSPRRRYVSWGLIFFVILWLSLGAMAQFTWMQSVLIPARIWRALLIALACWLWKLAAAYNLQGSNGWKKIGLWVLQTSVLMAALIVTASFVPGMGIIMLIAPVLPLILLVEGIIGNHFDDPWVFSVGGALLFGWLVASFFPLI
jgi:hypothetical protein